MVDPPSTEAALVAQLLSIIELVLIRVALLITMALTLGALIFEVVLTLEVELKNERLRALSDTLETERTRNEREVGGGDEGATNVREVCVVPPCDDAPPAS